MRKKNLPENLWGNSQHVRKKRRWITTAAAVAGCVGLAAGIMVYAAKRPNDTGYTIVKAQYPELAPYPEEPDGTDSSMSWDQYWVLRDAYRGQRTERIKQAEEYQEALYPFYEKTMRELLGGGKDENRAYSPLNLYMVLSMLAEVTDGNSRAQILELLNAGEIETVRESASALWNANYVVNDTVTSTLGNSLWLRKGDSYVQETMDRLAADYYASSFCGDMGSEEYTKAFQEWLNAQTGGFLEEQAGKQGFHPTTVLALASTIYYRASWSDPFLEQNTKKDVFHAASGDVSCDFMNQSDVWDYYRGDHFSAVCRGLRESGGMWLMLPEEGTSVNELIESGEILRLIREGKEWERKTRAQVNLSMPKFDLVSEMDLIDGLKAMGLTDIFDAEVSDFSPMIKEGAGLSVTEATHVARVAVDEKGCVAAAYSVVVIEERGWVTQEEVDFILNRPFLFAITGEDGSILFLSVVESI